MIKINLTENQLRVIREALDSFTRAKLGQFMYSLDHLVKTPKGARISYSDLRDAEELLKSIIFPELERNQNYGLLQEEVSDDARISYDIFKVIDIFLRRSDNEFCKTSKTEELPKIEEDN